MNDTGAIRILRAAYLALAVGLASAWGFSLEESRTASAKLERITNNELQAGETVTLTDDEINSYLHYEYTSEMPEGVRGMRVRFEPDIGVVTGLVDFQKLAEGNDSPGRFLLWMLRGEREVEARCRYVSANGEARIEIDSFKVNGREMKGPLLNWLVNNFVAPRMEGFELGRPVALGHNLEQVTLERGRAVVVAREMIARKSRP